MAAGTNQKLDRRRSQYFSSSAFKKPHFNSYAKTVSPGVVPYEPWPPAATMTICRLHMR